MFQISAIKWDITTTPIATKGHCAQAKNINLWCDSKDNQNVTEPTTEKVAFVPERV